MILTKRRTQSNSSTNLKDMFTRAHDRKGDTQGQGIANQNLEILHFVQDFEHLRNCFKF